MFDSLNENIPEVLKIIFVINRSIHLYETCSSIVFHISKAKMSRFGLNTLHYDGTNLWNNFYHAFIFKEPSLVKASLIDYFKGCLLYKTIFCHKVVLDV